MKKNEKKKSNEINCCRLRRSKMTLKQKQTPLTAYNCVSVIAQPLMKSVNRLLISMSNKFFDEIFKSSVNLESKTPSSHIFKKKKKKNEQHSKQKIIGLDEFNIT